MFSNALALLPNLLNERNEKQQLDIKKIIAATANSSIIVPFDLPNSFKEVKTTKQIPSRVDETLRI